MTEVSVASRKRSGFAACDNATALFAQAQLLDQRSIAVGVARFQVIEELAAPRHHPQQAPPRMVILDVDSEVLVEPVDAGGEKRDLDLRRAGVPFRALIVGDDLRLFCDRDGHVDGPFRLRFALGQERNYSPKTA